MSKRRKLSGGIMIFQKLPFSEWHFTSDTIEREIFCEVSCFFFILKTEGRIENHANES